MMTLAIAIGFVHNTVVYPISIHMDIIIGNLKFLSMQ